MSKAIMPSYVSVAFITVFVPDYKVWFYRELDNLFPGRFYAVHGPERKGTRPRDVGPLGTQNDILVKNRFFVIRGVELTWIPCVLWLLKKRPDIVILQDGVRIISNYVVHMLSQVMGKKIVYYTHGHNHQAELAYSQQTRSLVEKIRRFMLRRSNAVIVYTNANATYLKKHGVFTRTFVSNNTVDVPARLAAYSSINSEEIRQIRNGIGAQEGEQIIAFLGRLVPEKRVDIFVDVIRALNAGHGTIYRGLIVGDGPLLRQLQGYAEGVRVFFTGHQSGTDLAKYLACMECMFLPTHVGLALVEAFCAGKPLITLEGKYHSPEIDYLAHGVNGLVLNSNDPEVIAGGVAKLLNDRESLSRMATEARLAALALDPTVSLQAFEAAVKYAKGVDLKEAT